MEDSSNIQDFRGNKGKRGPPEEPNSSFPQIVKLEHIESIEKEGHLEKRVAGTRGEKEEKPKKRRSKYKGEKMQFFKDVLEYYHEKYFIPMRQQQIQLIPGLDAKLRQKITYVRYLTELSSAFFYFLHSAKLNLKTKQFCKLNQISQKFFNKAYLWFCKTQCLDSIKAEQSPQEEELHSVKKQQPQNLMGYTVVDSKTGQTLNKRITPIQALDLIFDGIFQKKSMQDRRHDLIMLLVQKCEQTQSWIVNGMDWTNDPLQKFYYLVFYYLRTHGSRLFFTTFMSEVLKQTNIQMVKDHTDQVSKLFKESQKALEEQGTTMIKEEDDRHSNYIYPLPKPHSLKLEQA